MRKQSALSFFQFWLWGWDIAIFSFFVNHINKVPSKIFRSESSSRSRKNHSLIKRPKSLENATSPKVCFYLRPDTRKWLLKTKYVLLDTYYLIIVTRYMLPEICYLIIVTWYLSICMLSNDLHLICVMKYLLPDTCYLILVTWYLLRNMCYLLLVTWHLLPDTCDRILVTW